jgi:hypothetical protein
VGDLVYRREPVCASSASSALHGSRDGQAAGEDRAGQRAQELRRRGFASARCFRVLLPAGFTNRDLRGLLAELLGKAPNGRSALARPATTCAACAPTGSTPASPAPSRVPTHRHRRPPRRAAHPHPPDSCNPAWPSSPIRPTSTQQTAHRRQGLSARPRRPHSAGRSHRMRNLAARAARARIGTRRWQLTRDVAGSLVDLVSGAFHEHAVSFNLVAMLDPGRPHLGDQVRATARSAAGARSRASRPTVPSPNTGRCRRFQGAANRFIRRWHGHDPREPVPARVTCPAGPRGRPRRPPPAYSGGGRGAAPMLRRSTARWTGSAHV